MPFAILSGPKSIPAGGWKEIPPYEPDWWRITASDFALTPAGAEAATSKKGVEAAKELDLFEQAEAREARRFPGLDRCAVRLPTSIRNN